MFVWSHFWFKIYKKFTTTNFHIFLYYLKTFEIFAYTLLLLQIAEVKKYDFWGGLQWRNVHSIFVKICGIVWKLKDVDADRHTAACIERLLKLQILL